ncbi:unnamed protein product [Sphagnum balticum]
MKLHSNIFGWDYVWRDFAETKGGEVINDETKENNPILVMYIPVEGTDAHVTITPYSLKGKTKSSGTSATLHYAPREHFVFAIRVEKGMDQIGKHLGLQDIQLGDHDFDHRFLIQGTDEGKVRNLFADMKLRDLILTNSVSELRLNVDSGELPAEHRVPAGRHAIVYNHEKPLDKFEQLESMFNILTSVVHRLGAMPALAGEYEEQFETTQEESQSNRLHSPLLDMA